MYERCLGENKQQQKTEMHFTITQAESCDKVKLLLFLITFYILFCVLAIRKRGKNVFIVVAEQSALAPFLPAIHEFFSAKLIFYVSEER